MSTKLLETKDKVQRLLTELLNNVQIDKDGRFHFRHESSHVFVRVREWNENTLVDVFAPTNFSVPTSPELFKYLALNSDSYVFGHFGALETEKGVNIIFTHTLLGDTLDPDELKWAVFGVAASADKVDDEIRTKFGGTVFHDS